MAIKHHDAWTTGLYHLNLNTGSETQLTEPLNLIMASNQFTDFR